MSHAIRWLIAGLAPNDLVGKTLKFMSTDNLKLVVFDCDGTLVDSQHTIVGCFQAGFESAGLSVPTAAAIRHNVGLSVHEFIRRLAPDVDDATVEEVLKGYRVNYAAMRSEPDYDEPLYPGVGDALDWLDQNGFLYGVATGKSLPGVHRTLEMHDLRERFVTFQTADLNPGKPNPAMINRAMEETGVEIFDTVMIGDTSFDMQMAQNAGVLAIGVSWGYHSDQELFDAGARAVIKSFDELPSLLDSHLGDPS